MTGAHAAERLERVAMAAAGRVETPYECPISASDEAVRFGSMTLPADSVASSYTDCAPSFTLVDKRRARSLTSSLAAPIRRFSAALAGNSAPSVAPRARPMPATRIGCSLHNDTKFRLRSAALSRAAVVAVPTDDVARRADSAARPYAPDARSRIWSILSLADCAAALKRAPAS